MFLSHRADFFIYILLGKVVALRRFTNALQGSVIAAFQFVVVHQADAQIAHEGQHVGAARLGQSRHFAQECLFKVGHSTPPNLLYNTLSDSWVMVDHCLVLTIRSDDLDFVHRKKDLGVVVQRIEDRLTGREEVVFK